MKKKLINLLNPEELQHLKDLIGQKRLQIITAKLAAHFANERPTSEQEKEYHEANDVEGWLNQLIANFAAKCKVPANRITEIKSIQIEFKYAGAATTTFQGKEYDHEVEGCTCLTGEIVGRGKKRLIYSKFISHPFFQVSSYPM